MAAQLVGRGLDETMSHPGPDAAFEDGHLAEVVDFPYHELDEHEDPKPDDEFWKIQGEIFAELLLSRCMDVRMNLQSIPQ
jgi:hypothetical protein